MKKNAKHLPGRKTLMAIAVIVGLLGTAYWYKMEPARSVGALIRLTTYKTNGVPRGQQNPTRSLSPFAGKPPRGFTINVEDLVLDQSTDPSVVKVERAEYEISRQYSPIPQRITGNKFVLKDKNFVNPKVKNSTSYLQSLGFDPDHYIPIVESPGYTQYGYMISYGELHRMIIYEGSFTQLTVFLSDPFTLEEQM